MSSIHFFIVEARCNAERKKDNNGGLVTFSQHSELSTQNCS